MPIAFIGCSQTKKKENVFQKTIKNVKFHFPASGFAFENRDNLIAQCFEAIQTNKIKTGIHDFTDTIQIRFLNSREELFSLTEIRASGLTVFRNKIIYIVADGNKAPPIRHELMHLMAMLSWGAPHHTSTWLNEGLAALAENNCNGYNVAQVYRYFMETEKLISIDSLAADFYKQPEMIAYHQSAYIVEYLLKNYGAEKFKQLWTQGFDGFESVYGISFSNAKIDFEKVLLKNYPDTPHIEWEKFEKGCY